MWSYLGDFSPGPPGTYYRNTGRQVNFFWNMFDQILIRPEIMDAFENENMRILTEIGQASLLGKYGKPDVNTGSDHLPIYFRINI
ncbi:MAG: hypothetical protein GY795_29210 [Desulfobacterales bacterium]|nr:hypothetical protein [Desulfobacterales bacterium]